MGVGVERAEIGEAAKLLESFVPMRPEE